MPTKKTDTTKKETPLTSLGQAKAKKAKSVAKPADKEKESLVEKVTSEKKETPKVETPKVETPIVKEEPTEAKEEKEAVDMPDDEVEKAIAKAALEGDKSKYIETVGRRKTASARVRLFTQGKKGIIVNGKPYTEFFPVVNLQKAVEDPMEKLKCLDKFGVTVIVKGGGPSGQAEAIRHGIARALVKLNPYFKKRLKKFGFLTRDPRMRERKKPGLKRARRAPQWSKR